MRTRRVYKSRKRQNGYIYLMKSDSLKGYKIGKTTDWKDRIYEMSVTLPIEFQYEYVFEVRDMTKAESTLHLDFADKRTKGEWFDLDEDDLTDIENIFFDYEDLIIYAANRRIPDRPVKAEPFRRETKAERFPIVTCPVCLKKFRREKKNYKCCSLICAQRYRKENFWTALPDWAYVTAGGVPPWYHEHGHAPHMNYVRDKEDNLVWEYYRLCDRD